MKNSQRVAGIEQLRLARFDFDDHQPDALRRHADGADSGYLRLATGNADLVAGVRVEVIEPKRSSQPRPVWR